MSDSLPSCPECRSEFTYELGSLLVCPECGREWSAEESAPDDEADAAPIVKDAVGNVLTDGDTVTIVKDLRVKGASGSIKVGTRVKGIRIAPGAGDHDLEGKVDGFGPMHLKSSVVKKV